MNIHKTKSYSSFRKCHIASLPGIARTSSPFGPFFRTGSFEIKLVAVGAAEAVPVAFVEVDSVMLMPAAIRSARVWLT